MNPYESPSSAAQEAGSKPTTYRRAITVAVVQQALVLFLAALVLDGGRTLRLVSTALLISFFVSLAIMLRWRDYPPALGAAVIKYGFWLVIVLVFLGSRLFTP